MRTVLLLSTLVAIAVLYFLPSELEYVKLRNLKNYTDKLVTTSGYVSGSKMCDGSTCIKLIGRVSRGPRVVTGQAAKNNGEVVLFVRRIE